MAIENSKIPALFFWLVVLGITVYTGSKVIGKVKENVSEVFT